MTSSACLLSVNARNVMRSNVRIIFALTADIIKIKKLWKWWELNRDQKTGANLVFDTGIIVKSIIFCKVAL